MIVRLGHFVRAWLLLCAMFGLLIAGVVLARAEGKGVPVRTWCWTQKAFEDVIALDQKGDPDGANQLYFLKIHQGQCRSEPQTKIAEAAELVRIVELQGERFAILRARLQDSGKTIFLFVHENNFHVFISTEIEKEAKP